MLLRVLYNTFYLMRTVPLRLFEALLYLSIVYCCNLVNHLFALSSVLSLNWKVMLFFCRSTDSHSDKSTDGWSLRHFNRKWRWVCHIVADYFHLSTTLTINPDSDFFSWLIIVSMKNEKVRLILAVQAATFPRSPLFSAVCHNSLMSPIFRAK